MKLVKHKVAVMSGKGGVGKSFVTVNLALAFASQSCKVGILDADINGPCIPKMFGVQDQQLKMAANGAYPVTGPMGVKVASMELLLSSEGTPVMWGGPTESSHVWQAAMEQSVIREFLSDIVWGELDFLFIDLPPGTGDKLAVVMQLIPDLSGAIIITIPSAVSELVVNKSVALARKLELPIIGMIENMSGFVCPNCNNESDLFAGFDAEELSRRLGTLFLGKIPFDRQASMCSDNGIPFITTHNDSPASKALTLIAEKIRNSLSGKNEVLVR